MSRSGFSRNLMQTNKRKYEEMGRGWFKADRFWEGEHYFQYIGRRKTLAGVYKLIGREEAKARVPLVYRLKKKDKLIRVYVARKNPLRILGDEV